MSHETLYTTTLCSLLLTGCGSASDETLQMELNDITPGESSPTPYIAGEVHRLGGQAGLSLEELRALEIVEPENLIQTASLTHHTARAPGGDGAVEILPRLDGATSRLRKGASTPKGRATMTKESGSRKGNRSRSGGFPPVV